MSKRVRIILSAYVVFIGIFRTVICDDAIRCHLSARSNGSFDFKLYATSASDPDMASRFYDHGLPFVWRYYNVTLYPMYNTVKVEAIGKKPTFIKNANFTSITAILKGRHLIWSNTCPFKIKITSLLLSSDFDGRHDYKNSRPGFGKNTQRLTSVNHFPSSFNTLPPDQYPEAKKKSGSENFSSNLQLMVLALAGTLSALSYDIY